MTDFPGTIRYEPVILNVYDMMPINGYTKLLGIGVFHSGVEIYGSEYAYGGHLSTFTGIYDMNPKDALILGEDFKFKRSEIVGYTPLTKEEVQQIIAHLGREYIGNKYSIVSKNCNHFTRDFCIMLCGRGIPRWINRLANGIEHIPFLKRFVEQNMGIRAMTTQKGNELGEGDGIAPEPDPETISTADSTGSTATTASTADKKQSKTRCWSTMLSSKSSQDDSNSNAVVVAVAGKASSFCGRSTSV